MSASVKPIVKTIINKNKTYFGALEVIAKILLGSKDLNIIKLYILKKIIDFYYGKWFWSRMQRELIMIKCHLTLLTRI